MWGPGSDARGRLPPPRRATAAGLAFALCFLVPAMVGFPAAAQEDPETPEQVNLAFGGVITTVWGNGTRYDEFQVDAFGGAALNLSIVVTASRNTLRSEHAALLTVSFPSEAIENLTVQVPFEVGPDTPRRLPLPPVNITLPASLPEGDYRMVLTLDTEAEDPFPQSNRLEVPLLIGERDYGREPYVFRPAYLIGVALLGGIVVAAAGYARIVRREGYRRWAARRSAFTERLIERWTHDPRRGLYKVVLTLSGLLLVVLVLARLDFFVVPSANLLYRSIITGLLVGAIYALVALGYTMVYGVLKFINFAHGEVLMWGAYAALYLSVMQDLPFFVGVIGAVLFAAVLGAGIERMAYRPLRGKPRLTPLITAIGVSLFLQGAAQFFFTTRSRGFRPAFDDASIGGHTLTDLLRERVFTVQGVPVNGLGVTILALSVLLMVGLHLFIRHTRLGKALRAVADDFETASIIGIDVNRVITTTFIIGSSLAAIAGILFGARFAVSPTMGFMPGMKAFTAAVVGGIGNVYGAFVGGFVIGLAEYVGAAFLRERGFQHAIAFVILILVLILRPTGIFAAKESEVRRK